MNDANQLYFLALLGLAFILIGLLSGIVVYLLLKSKDKANTSSSEASCEVVPKTTIEDDLIFCQNHEKELSKGSCSICDKSFCESCLQEWDGLNFCSEHLKLFSENKWVGITNIKTTPNNPEAAMYIYQFKQEQWKVADTPSYIVTHYKINFEGDHIESYVMLYVRSQDEEVLKGMLNQIN